jgi:hypothetical protein
MALSLKREARFAPREPRAAVAIESWLILPDDRVSAITIRNLSTSGFMGEADVEIQSGTWLGVVVPGCGIARALIRWSEEGEIGGQFRRPLNLKRLEECLTGKSIGTDFLGARVLQQPVSFPGTLNQG